MRSGAKGGDGEVELVEETEGLVDGVDDLFEILRPVIGWVGGGGGSAAVGIGGGGEGVAGRGCGSCDGGEATVAGGGVQRRIHSPQRFPSLRANMSSVLSRPGIAIWIGYNLAQVGSD